MCIPADNPQQEALIKKIAKRFPDVHDFNAHQLYAYIKQEMLKTVVGEDGTQIKSKLLTVTFD